jgi:hypothetical protein
MWLSPPSAWLALSWATLVSISCFIAPQVNTLPQCGQVTGQAGVGLLHWIATHRHRGQNAEVLDDVQSGGTL